MKELKEKIEALKQQYINERNYAKSALLRDIEKDLFPEPKWKAGDEHMTISDVHVVDKDGIPHVRAKEELRIAPAQEASKYVKVGETVWVEMIIAENLAESEYFCISVGDGYEDGGYVTDYSLDNRVKIAYKP